MDFSIKNFKVMDFSIKNFLGMDFSTLGPLPLALKAAAYAA